jgi:redox-sensitive bicupin YhaK (pirin superfamily)
MITIRRAHERGFADHGWLKTYHTFSFANYQDPRHVHFRALRVMNEDIVAPSQGFGTHPHDNMEIVTYVMQGALEHRDSMGNGEVLRAGEFQRMSAGSGITHSEFNPSSSEPVHLYQIWLFPDKRNIAPSYEQKRFDPAQRVNSLQLVASPDGADGSLHINQDARIYLSRITEKAALSLSLAQGRAAWVQVLSGEVMLEQVSLYTSDGAAVSNEDSFSLIGTSSSEVMIFDLP